MIKRLHERKGQAAMEFLMTYGWAILAAIIAIGVLAYFGVFSPGKLVADTALIAPPFGIDDFIIEDVGVADTVRINIIQNGGSTIRLLNLTGSTAIKGLNVTMTSPASVVCTVTALPNVFEDTTPTDGLSDNPWPSGNIVAFTATCGDTWAKGDSVAGSVDILYVTSGSTFTKSVSGTFRGTSQ